MLSAPISALLCGALAMFFGLIGSAHATKFYETSFENQACNETITDAVTPVDGKYWDLYFPAPLPTVRCATSPAGSKHVEWTNGDLQHETLIEVLNVNISLVSGTTYYLAGYFRFERTGGVDIWQDTVGESRAVACGNASDAPNSFDKLFEFRGTGFRWGIGSGWANSGYPGSHDHKFTFDAWCAASAITGCEAEYANDFDHKTPNANGYTASSPFLADYERWYAVVLGITAHATAGSGRIQLWINGTQVIDRAHKTMDAGAVVSSIMANGTYGQPCYDLPAHKRQIDGMLLTDVFSDVAAYMADPNGGSAANLAGAANASSSATGSVYIPLPRPTLNRVPR